MLYDDFSLTLDPQSDGSCTVTVSSPAGDGRRTFRIAIPGETRPGTEIEPVAGPRRELDSDARESFDPTATGDRLFQALFSGQVLNLFERSLGLIGNDQDRGLRIVLRFDPEQPGTARLAALPWELLYRRESREFLNFNRRIPLVRFLNVPRSLPPRLEPPVRILVAIASPEGYTTLDVQREIERIEEALQNVPNAEKSFLREATPEALRARLLEEPFHVLHFIGHGTFDVASGQGILVFEDGAGKARPVPGPVVADLLRDFVSLRLVFLNACKTARFSEEVDPFAGLAAALTMAGVPAVLGMQIPISDGAAIAFSEAFYRRLAAGDPIDTATVEGRMTLHLRDFDSQEWATPVLFLRDKDARLFDAKPTSAQPGISSEIRSGIIDDAHFVADKTAGFVGRKWLFDAVSQFMREKPRGYFIVRGDPGIGKSAFLAQMVRREGYIHHFNVRADGVRSPAKFLTNVCSQLIATYGLGQSSLPPDATRDATFLNSLLGKVSDRLDPGEKAVILVDALDESETTTLTQGANPLYLPITLPPGVFLIATTRREALDLRIECEQRTLDIEQDSEGNIADVREFVESKLVLPGIRTYIAAQSLTDLTFVDEMVAKSQGNFMYLRYVFPEIESGYYKDLEFSSLPEGLQNYYEDHWRRLRSRDKDEWLTYQVPVLVALTVIKEPISIDLIEDFADVHDRRRVREVLRDWDSMLYTASALDDEGQPQKRYRLYHASFHDFIAAKDEIKDEGVSLKSAHNKIVAALLRDDD